MRFIPTAIHGAADYVLGLLLIAAPWLFGFADNGAETWVPVLLGVSVLIYSMLTNYEAGLVRMIDMRTHLWLDAAGGALLAVSPWLFGFAEHVWIPHVVVGLVEIGSALCTQTVSPVERHPRPGAPVRSH